MRILVTGAAGYIGSIVTEYLIEQDYTIIALDNLKHGHKAAVNPLAKFYEMDLLDSVRLDSIFQQEAIDAVVHLAAEALIDVSVKDPALFYYVNVIGSLNLLNAMVKHNVNRIIFSSTAAVYGEPEIIPIIEESVTKPINPYGETKLTIEKALGWYGQAYGIKHISLRYFNACGASENFGEDHKDLETHLIPILLEAALGQREQVYLFGMDYPTPDGTCIRDYIHVRDIANAHWLALQNLDNLSGQVFNMGNGNGFSNLELINKVQDVTSKKLNIIPAPRRAGDPAVLVADYNKITFLLGWTPMFSKLDDMIGSAWKWKLRNPKGYAV